MDRYSSPKRHSRVRKQLGLTAMAKLKIAGAWAGVLDVELEAWTVPMLREEVAKRSNTGPESINLICSGKVLKDGDSSQKLSQLGIKNNAKILATRVSADEGKSMKNELLAEEERSSRLARLKAAATALSQRHSDGSLPDQDFSFEIENQGGQRVDVGSETDKKAIMMGLILHANAKKLIKKEMYKDALEVLTMGEEAFSLCNSKLLELVDNVPILQIDMVWCYFLLQDISWLSVAGVRLEKAREGIEHCHGKDLSRIRLLQAGRQPELALHVRLELLEGIVAYHSGQFVKSFKALTSAQEKFLQLQVSDEALSLVMSMGFKECDAKRALRLNNQDVGIAIDFLVEEKAKREQKRVDDIQHKREIMEQKRYGVTPLKKAVNLEMLKELASIGFAKDLAAETLRRNENDFQKALDDLTNPETNAVIQLDIQSRKKRSQQRTANARIEELVSMGFERSRVIAAVQAGGTMAQITNRLLPQSEEISTAPNDNNANPSALESSNPDLGTDDVEGDLIDCETLGEPSTAGQSDDRDVEMEDEITAEVGNLDALSDYDIELNREGVAIGEYLSLLASSNGNLN